MDNLKTERDVHLESSRLIKNALKVVLLPTFCLLALGTDTTANLEDMKVPITIFGAIILAWGPKIVDVFTGSRKEEKQERMQTALTLSRLCTKMDVVVAAQKEDKEEMKDMRKEVQQLDIKISTEVGKLYTAIAGKENIE